MHQGFPAGITNRLGVILIGVVVLVMGIGVYIVYTQTQTNGTDDIAFEITLAQSSIINRIEEEAIVSMGVSSPSAGEITLSVASVPEAVTAFVSKTVLLPGQTTELHVTGPNPIEGTVELLAKQGNSEARASVPVKLFTTSSSNSSGIITNSATGSPGTTVTTIGSENQFTNSDIGIRMNYPTVWGDAFEPVLDKLQPVTGDIIYIQFKDIVDVFSVGQVTLAQATNEYTPRLLQGAPFWFVGQISSTTQISDVRQQLLDQGFSPQQIERVTIGGHQAIRFVNYRWYTNHFLEVAYLIPTPGTSDTSMLLRRTVHEFGSKEMSSEDASSLLQTAVEQLVNNTLPQASLDRISEFDRAVTSLVFTK